MGGEGGQASCPLSAMLPLPASLCTNGVWRFSICIYALPGDEAINEEVEYAHEKKTKCFSGGDHWNSGVSYILSFGINTVMGSVRSSCSDISISSHSPFVLFMDLNWISGLQLPSSWWCRNVWIGYSMGSNQLFSSEAIYRIFNFPRFCHMFSADMNNYCKLGFSIKWQT